MARLEFSRKVRVEVKRRASGHCEKCKAVLKPAEGEIDHILPDALGGKPEAQNAQLLCRVCHTEKTASDVRRIRKADRQRDKGNGAIRAKSSLSSPKLPKPPLSKILPPRVRDVFGRNIARQS